ncbi:MAG: CHAD domain-containing protein [Bradyrhizobium sp.]|jgi:inorganic triphosphatase YgiF
MSVEVELKFRAAACELQKLIQGQIQRDGKHVEHELVSIYFDTPKHKLRRHGLSLRVRHIGDKRVQTIKSTINGQFGRGEWESEIEGDTPDLGKASGSPLERLASRKFSKKLRPVFETRVHRTSLPVCCENSDIELVVDRGKIVAGSRSSPIEEFELELKKGKLENLFSYAKAIERETSAELYLRSKSERGYALVTGAGAVHAEPIKLTKDMEPSDAFRTIAHSTVRHFAANADAVHNFDPEGIHQMRVGLRRLRAAISLFSGLVPERTEEIKNELKWLTSELAPAREIDVFKQKIGRRALKVVPLEGTKALEEEFAARGNAAIEHARNAVSSERYRTLLITLLQWIELSQDAPDRGARIKTVKFARKELHRRLKKVGKTGRALKNLSGRERHKFRIKIKKARYAVEFFESLFPGKHDRKQLTRLFDHLKNVQDALGSLNDFIAHQRMAADVALNAPAQNRRARAFASGVVLGREDVAVKPLVKTAAKEVAALRRINLF